MTSPSTGNAPRQIGRFVVEGELGRGGMGVVYAARDTRLDRIVAIKALSDRGLGDAHMRARFEREAKLVAALNHPNVAAIYGVEEQDGATFLVFERVEGETLTERLERRPMAPMEAVSICGQVATGVAAAHRRGIVHRDLKPDNIKITPDGTAKVLDFGIGKQVGPLAREPQPEATEEGALLGTFGFMSPEQVRGEAVDERCDVWALGCILFQCLTGQLAFGGRTYADAIANVLTRDPDWAALPRGTPVRVKNALHAALAKDPRDRLKDASEFAAMLPGGIAVRAALAAGETPTPAMIAAAGEPGVLRPRYGLAWAGLALVCIAATVWFKGSTQLVARLPLDKPPAVLVDRARTLLDRLEVPRSVFDTRSMWAFDDVAASWFESSASRAVRSEALAAARPTPLIHWYRESPSSMAATGIAVEDDRGDITRVDPPLTEPGMVIVELDPRGRLLGLRRVPLDSERDDGSPAEGLWPGLFSEAGLVFDRFTPVAATSPLNL